MKKCWLANLVFLAVMVCGALATAARAQEPASTAAVEITSTASPTATPQPTASPTASPTAPSAVTAALEVTVVEPRAMVNDVGGTLSVYGTGFTSESAVRLIGYGLLAASYVHPTALTAQVPIGLPAGTYDVEVSDGVARAILRAGLTVLAPTPTPRPKPPAAPPPPGRPILTVRNYAVEPAQVRVGQEFVVTVEIYNNGSRAGENTLVMFPGDPFLPVGEPGHVLGQIHINHVVVVTQRMRAPSSLGSGVHQLTVNLGANDWEGNHYDYPQQIPVEVIGGGGGGAPAGRPRLVMEASRTDPMVVTPGEAFTLTLRIENVGSRAAVDAFVALASSKLVVPAMGAGSASIGSIPSGEGVTVTLPLLLGDVEAGGRQILTIDLEYGDTSGGTHSDQQNVGVNVDAGLSRRPQLVIEDYSTTPDFLTPGDTFTLTIRAANVGGGEAERLTFALGGDGGAHLEPFIPLRSGNVIFVPALDAGTTMEITRQLIVDGSAEPKAYNLPIALAYDDSQGTREEDVQRLSLVVRRRPELQATFYREPEGMTVGSATSISLELVNVGLGPVNLARIAPSSPQMDVEIEGTPFMGTVEVGGSAPLDVAVTPRESGRAELVMEITYRDDFNQLQVFTRTVALEVTESPGSFPGPSAPGGPVQSPHEALRETVWTKIGRAIKGFLGFGS